ncbi:hypothetical protein [Nesterenkonia alba]|uniref:hypothetical protein n=1 Tax=Nesterenkonia alba TaxID=515814 RepID=UPI0003B5C873|nr:hypothetical protein [Nesterenkonia alba]
MSLLIEPVTSQTEVEEFIHLGTGSAGRLGRCQGHHVPLMADDIRAWARGEHPGVDIATLHLVRDSATGRAVARMVVHRSALLDARLRAAGVTTGTGALYFGALEWEHTEALHAALDWIEAEAARTGAGGVFGPVSLLPNQVGAAVTGGFEHPGFFDSPWNDAELPEILASRGFEPWYPAATWEVPVQSIPADRRRRPHAEEYRAAGVRRVPVRRWRFRGRRGVMEQLRAGLNASFAQLPYYTEISRAQMTQQTAGLELLADPRLIVTLAATGHGEDGTNPEQPPLASFALVVPDPVDALRGTGGRLGVQELPGLLRRRLPPVRQRQDSLQDAVLIVQGTHPRFQGRGLLSLVSRELFAQLYEGGYRKLRVTFIGEENPASAAVFARAGGYRLHRLAFFRKELSGGAQPEVTVQTVASWVEIAGRAPSAHNTQPWAPEVIEDDEGVVVRLRVHPDRVLPVGDPTFRDLYLSLGAWVESLDAAAAEAGVEVEIRAVTGSGTDTQLKLGFVPRTGVVPAQAEDVLTRRVYRGTLQRNWEALVEAGHAAGLSSLAGLVDLAAEPAEGGEATATGAPKSVEAVAVDPVLAAAWERVAARHFTASGQLMTELLQWLRIDPQHPDYHRDGLSLNCLLPENRTTRSSAGLMAQTLAGGVLRSAPARRITPAAAGIIARMTPDANESALQRAERAASERAFYPSRQKRILSRISKAVRGVPLGAVRGAARLTEVPDDGRGNAVVLFVTAPESEGTAHLDPAGLIEAGRVLQRFWLQLHRRGLAVHPVSEVVDEATTRRAASRWVTSVLTPTDEHGEQTGPAPEVVPVAFFRAGVPADVPPRSARLTAR